MAKRKKEFMKLQTNLGMNFPIEVTFPEALDPDSVNQETAFLTSAGESKVIPAKIEITQSKNRTLKLTPERIPAGEYELHLTDKVKTVSGRKLLGGVVIGVVTTKP